MAHPGTLGGGGIDRVGKTFIQLGGGYLPVDLSTGRSKEVYVHLWINKGKLRIGTGTDAAREGFLDGAAPDPDYFMDATDRQHILLAGSAYSRSTGGMLVLMEAGPAKLARDYLRWWMPTLHGRSLRPVAARYEATRVKAWLVRQGNKQNELCEAVADSQHSGELRVTSAIACALPLLNTRLRYFPERQQFVVLRDGRCRLMTVSGRVLGDVPESGEQLINHEIKAVWDLMVPDRSVPQGKRAWIPVSYSADLHNWLVFAPRDSKMYLLKI